ncbi:MAG: magnesium/cobalt efflux protein, partial [Deltaproteobacteria bacterium]
MSDIEETDEKSRSRGGLFSRLRDALGGKEQAGEPSTPDVGLGQMRVDDVMIPTAEVVAIPDD